MTIRNSKDYIRVLLYSYYTTITGWGVLLRNNDNNDPEVSCLNCSTLGPMLLTNNHEPLMPVTSICPIHWILPPLSDSGKISIIWLHIALSRAPTIDCHWGGQYPTYTASRACKKPCQREGPPLQRPSWRSQGRCFQS